jgi:hypothetical protein
MHRSEDNHLNSVMQGPVEAAKVQSGESDESQEERRMSSVDNAHCMKSIEFAISHVVLRL